MNLVYLIQRARNVFHHKKTQWIIVLVSPSWILIDFSFQDAVKFCDAKSCWNANMSTHSWRVWAISLYYWPCSNTCETGPPFVPIPYKSFLLQSFSLHKSWRKVSCMAIQINCLAIKGYQDTQVGPSCSFMQTFLKSNRWMDKWNYLHVFLIQQYFCIDSFQPKYLCFTIEIFWADSSSNLLFTLIFFFLSGIN